MSYRFSRGQYVTSAGDAKTNTPGGTFRVISVSQYGGRGDVYQCHNVDDPQILHEILIDERFLTADATSTDKNRGQKPL